MLLTPIPLLPRPIHGPLAVVAAEVLPGGVAKLTVQTGATMPYEAGQYVWIAFTALPDTPEWVSSLSFHPYSISSAYTPGDETYTLHVKSMGEGTWSDAVVRAAKGGAAAFGEGNNCRVGGPSGRFSVNPRHLEHVVVVGGGIGITPLASLVREICNDAASSASHNDSGSRSSRHYPLMKTVTVVWAVQSADCLDWFQQELRAAAERAAVGGVAVDLQFFVTRARGGGKKAGAEGGDVEAAGQPAAAFTAGRPDLKAILAKIAAEAAAARNNKGGDDAALSAGEAARLRRLPVGVFACGPEAMLDDTRTSVAVANQHAAAASGGKRFLLHTEVFLF